jgi:PAS domain S-box-containing protein
MRSSVSILDSLVNTSPDGVFAFDRECRYTFWSPAMERISGVPASDAIGARAFDLFPFLRETGEEAYFYRALAGERATVVDRHFVIPETGHEGYFDAYYAPLADETGSVVGGLAVVRDITERKQAERISELLRHGEERYRAFVEQSTEGIWRAELDVPVDVTLPADEQIELFYEHTWLAECNDAMARMYGYDTADELVGARLGDLLVRSDPANVDYLGAFVASGYRLAGVESSEVDREGREKYFENSLIGVVEHGCLLRAWGTQRDVTERKHGEIERERLLRQAQEASRLKDEFLATVSHELRTPLNALLGWSRMLRSGALDEAQREKAVEVIERNVVAQAQLVEDLLDVSRIVTGNLRLEIATVDLVAVTRAAVESVRPAADAKRIALGLDGPEGGLSVAGDAARLQQVVWNLLSNAVKFTPEGGRVEVLVARDDAGARVAVRDTGAGIDPSFLPFVFDTFRQADATTTRLHSGLGLGLSIVRHLVELHGGEVDARSPGLGHGATFVVRLPLPAPDALAAADAPARSARKALGGVRVLVVDDEPDARELLAFVLEAAGARVETVASAAEALERFDAYLPDVLISDIGMPVEDGYTLARRLRDRGTPVPAVALTAYARAEDRELALESGFQAHIAKPVEPADLVRLVARLASQKEKTPDASPKTDV